MKLDWKIRYLDRNDKQFKDRELSLDTQSLDPVTRAAIELVVENSSSKNKREILKYRHLFSEEESQGGHEDSHAWDKFKAFCVSDYFEDENGVELTLQEIGPIVTGNPDARWLPASVKQHDIDYTLAPPEPIPVASITLTSEEIRVLAYFSRDLKELLESAFIKDGPCTITARGTLSGPASNPVLETAVTDDEIRSFVTIFRRLYMEKEPANLQKSVAVFTKALGDHPLAKWVLGAANEFQNHLSRVPDSRHFIQPGTCTFTVKRLIDVFLYTQYAHQPNEQRERQFMECLAEVYGKRALLTFQFLTGIWVCSLEIGNIGRIVVAWFKRYCEHHGISPDVLISLRDDHPGLGVMEKADEKRARLFREKSEGLAFELWKENGCPDGGPTQFFVEARSRLSQMLGE